MAITGTGVPTNTTNIQLPNDVSQEIIAKTVHESMVMRLARQIALPGRGVQIPVIASDPEADWVEETGKKPVSNPELDKKIMSAHKLAVIVPFSNEFRRDVAALYDALVSRLPGALAKKFDQTVFFGATGALANFDNFAAVTQQNISANPYQGLVAADADISEEGGILNGIILAPQGKSILLGAVDGQRRPLFINSVSDGAVPRVLGAETHVTSAAFKAGTPDIVGFAGDWSKALFGTVEGVQIGYSSDATLEVSDGQGGTTTISLFQQNMFAVRAEIEVGFVAQTDFFNALTRTNE